MKDSPTSTYIALIWNEMSLWYRETRCRLNLKCWASNEVVQCFGCVSLFSLAALFGAAGNFAIGQQPSDRSDSRGEPNVSRGSPKQRRVLAIVIAKAVWWAKIYDDGTGTIGRGSGLGLDVSLKGVDTDELLKHLRGQLSTHQADSRLENAYGAEFVKGNDRTVLWASGPKPVAEVFDVFRKAAQERATSPQASVMIGDLWDQNPPTPISEPWADDGKRPIIRARAIRTAGQDGAQREMIAVIRQDGSGYGGSGNLAYFPPKTFDAQAILSRIKPKFSQEIPNVLPGDNFYSATFFQGKSKETLYAKEPSPVVEVFDQLRKACHDHKADGSKQFEAAWRAFPRSVLSTQWDDK